MTVTVVRSTPGGTDAYGDSTSSTERRTLIHGAIIAPVRSTEVTGDGRSAVIVGYTLFVPSDTDLTTNDTIEISGAVFKVDGQVADWVNPYTGDRRGIEVRLRRVEG